MLATRALAFAAFVAIAISCSARAALVLASVVVLFSGSRSVPLFLSGSVQSVCLAAR